MRPRDLHILRGILARGRFGHREHLELAWSYLGQYDADAAREAMTSAIREVAASHGAPDRYHDTITRSWLHLVAIHRSASAASSFDEFIADNGGLLDRHLLSRHYSEERIASDAARAGWVDPDLRPLPVSEPPRRR
jgi:hypothetical protein